MMLSILEFDIAITAREGFPVKMDLTDDASTGGGARQAIRFNYATTMTTGSSCRSRHRRATTCRRSATLAKRAPPCD